MFESPPDELLSVFVSLEEAEDGAELFVITEVRVTTMVFPPSTDEKVVTNSEVSFEEVALSEVGVGVVEGASDESDVCLDGSCEVSLEVSLEVSCEVSCEVS